LAKMAKIGQKPEKCPFWAIFRILGLFRAPEGSPGLPAGGVLHQPLAPGPRGSPGRGLESAPPRRGGTPPEEGAGGLPLGRVAGAALSAGLLSQPLFCKGSDLARLGGENSKIEEA